MTSGTGTHRGGEPQQLGTLVRSLPVALVEVSRGGCRLECSSRLESGASGQLAVELDGLLRVDDVRIARCQQRMGAGAVYQVGAELLRLRRLGRRTIRMAVRRIISGEWDGGHTRLVDRLASPQEVQMGEVNQRTECRAPPVRLHGGP